MLESLVSLSILALFIGVVFPFAMELMVIREQTKTNVELNRFLYETALFYDQGDLKSRQFVSGDVKAHSIEIASSIRIYAEEDLVSSVELITAEWNP
ncbi:hypothetical protein SAMN04488102_103194 [Alkalibacterium subtropicum]|uniref:Competence protein ComGE n=2 Tax=Alkalibacterium subtropicum TaxID=753702 RepID=A0A1I1GY08_9LACT|nr:hypothetical protein SAMN04488102_103194 [Alkalibacterium subtropicum]